MFDAKSICAIISIIYGFILFLIVYYKKHSMNKGAFIFMHLSILYFILLFAATLFPLSNAKKSSPNLYPFVMMFGKTDSGYVFNTSIFLSYWLLSFLNIAMFVPLGCILTAVCNKRTLLICILCGFAISFFIELLQLVLPFDRVFDIDDIIFNTIGSTLGYFVAMLITKILRRRNESLRYK